MDDNTTENAQAKSTPKKPTKKAPAGARLRFKKKGVHPGSQVGARSRETYKPFQGEDGDYFIANVDERDIPSFPKKLWEKA